MIAALASAVHVLALGVGLGAIYARYRALAAPVNVAAVLRADNFWGLAALMWIGSGLARAFGGLEKGTAWYLHNNLFQLKMGLYVAAAVLELWPMYVFILWRVAEKRGQPIDIRHAPRLRLISGIEAALVCAMPFVAAAMARGLSF